MQSVFLFFANHINDLSEDKSHKIALTVTVKFLMAYHLPFQQFDGYQCWENCPSVPGHGPERLNLRNSEHLQLLDAPIGFTGDFVVFIPLVSGPSSAHRIPAEVSVSYSWALKAHLFTYLAVKCRYHPEVCELHELGWRVVEMKCG